MSFFKKEEQTVEFSSIKLLAIKLALEKEISTVDSLRHNDEDFVDLPVKIFKSSPAVLAVYKLVHALDSYKGELPEEVNFARISMMKELTEHLQKYIDTRKTYKAEFRYDEGTEAFRTFKENCNATMEKHYKALASEPGLWNWIKDCFNDARKYFGYEPLKILDASVIMQDATIKEKLEAAKAQGIGSAAEDEIEPPKLQ